MVTTETLYPAGAELGTVVDELLGVGELIEARRNEIELLARATRNDCAVGVRLGETGTMLAMVVPVELGLVSVALGETGRSVPIGAT